MHPNERIEELIAALRATPSAELDARVHRAIAAARAERKQTDSWIISLGSILMKTRATKWAATAAAIVGFAAVILVLHKAVPSAYGIERVIAAYNNIRFLHIKDSDAKGAQPSEFWIECDQAGRVTRARYYLPVTEDGAKLITWTPQRTELWFQGKHGFVTFQTKRIQPWMQSLLDQSQPQLVLKKLLEGKKAGKVDFEMQEPQDASQGGTIVVTRKGKPGKEIYHLDPKTDLITRIEWYRIEGGTEVLASTKEFCDYNTPIADKMFSLRGELPKDVRISDRLNQIAGVPQQSMTDAQAAAETVRQFFQALLDKDYKKAGLIECGELEEYAKAEYGKINVTAIISIGPPVPQPKWDKRGFKVPCKLELTGPDGQKTVWEPGAYVRPGDDEMHPDYWNITGGVSAGEAAIKILPDNAKYASMTPKAAAAAFFKACADRNWGEVMKFWPSPESDPWFERMKEHIGGLEVISLGEPYQKDEYPGWYVPYEIKVPAFEVNIRVSNANPAKRYVILGFYDSKLRPQEELEWPTSPEVLPDNDAYASLSPTDAAKAYLAAMSTADWTEMRKFAPESDVESTKRQFAEAEKRGLDARQSIPVADAGEAVWSAEQSAWFVKCHVPSHVKKWNLAMRNDNIAKRFLWDGGL
jgi:hypothetical protein